MNKRIDVAVKGHPGIRRFMRLDEQSGEYKKITDCNGYKVTKSIKGERFIKTFPTLREAVAWKNSFNPMQNINHQNGESLETPSKKHIFGDIYDKYKECMFTIYERSTIDYKLKLAVFFDGLQKLSVNEITPDFLDYYIKKKKEYAVAINNKRYNFNRELTELKTIFNWYKENIDYTYHIPLLKRHFNQGIIKKVAKKNKKMSPGEVILFFKSLKENCNILFYDFAITQFYTAGRVQETAGLQKSCINLEGNQLMIKYVVVWDRNKNFQYLKDVPKNGEVRYCTIIDIFRESLRRQMEASSDKCSYVFQIKGKPIPYRTIQYQYNRALKKCGLYPKYSSTHILRHTMASITRNVTESLDFTQAVTGHKDIRLVQHYSGSPSSKQAKAVEKVANFLKNMA